MNGDKYTFVIPSSFTNSNLKYQSTLRVTSFCGAFAPAPQKGPLRKRLSYAYCYSRLISGRKIKQIPKRMITKFECNTCKNLSTKSTRFVAFMEPLN